MPPETEAAIATKSDRAKISASDYVFPEWKKCPITSQGQARSAATLIAKTKKPDGSALTDAEIKTAKARAKRIMNRKGFTLPKSWQTDKPKAKAKESVALSDDEIRGALQDALRDDPDPDGDGDMDCDPEDDMWWRGPHCYVSDVYSSNGTFVYSFDDDGDYDDDGLYMRSFTLDANGTATLGNDIKRVVRQVTYVDYEEQTEDEMTDSHRPPGLMVPTINLTESTTVREAFTEWGPLMEADGMMKGKIRGTAITPGFNKSGQRYYPKETLAASAPKLIGKKMYIDHPGRVTEKNLPERSVMEAAAVIDNAWVGADGSIQYEATVFDPTWDAKLAMMRERGVLGACGTSINYQGMGKENAEVEGRRTCLIEQILDYNSLDFVTEAGAGGTVAALESDAAESANERDDAVNEEVKNLIESLRAEVAESRKEAQDARDEAARERRIAAARGDIVTMLGESDLPKSSHPAILDAFEGAESTDGVAEAIEKHGKYLETVFKEMNGGNAPKTGAVAPQRKRGVVLGLGSTQQREESESDRKASTPPKLESVAGWLNMGATEKDELGKFFVTG